MDILLKLVIAAISVTTVLSQDLKETEEAECRKRVLRYGQTYYMFRDNKKNINATNALRGSGRWYKGGINQYAEFFVVVPNVYHGVAVEKLCMFTHNVISVNIIINKEALPDVFGEPEHVLHMTEYVQHSKDENARPKSKKTCFYLGTVGDIASIIIKLNKGIKRRVRVANIQMEACEGENYNFL